MGKSKKLLALGIVCSLLLGGCGGTSQETSKPAGESQTAAVAESEVASEQTAQKEDSGEKKTLRVAWWGTTTRDQLYYKINDLFMEEHPDVEIVTESPGWNDYWTAQSTAFASGSAADVVQFQSNQIGEYCSKNVLAPLDDYVTSGIINLDNWNEGFVDTGRYNDNLYMVSLGMTAQALYVNETFLNELGMELWDEDEDITWDEFADYLNEVQAKLGQDTYAGLDIYTNNDLVWIWIRENCEEGYEWLDKDGNFAPSEETLASWYEYSDNLRKSGAFANVEWTQEWNSKAWEEGPLVNRKILFYFANANQYKTYQNSMEDKLAIRKVPVGNNGQHGDLLITSAFAISETSQNKELAAEYINFFVNNEEAQKIFNMELGVPASMTIQELLEPSADPSDIAATKYLNMISEEAPPFIAKAPGVWAIQNEISSVAEQVAVGNMTPDDAAKHIKEIANEMIAENAN